jgi:hypothetical protein
VSNAENKTHGGKGVNVPSAAVFNATASAPEKIKGGVWVYCATTKKMIEKYSIEDQERVNAPAVRREISAFKSPIDGSVITTRRELANHNKRHGVTNVSDYSEGYIKNRAHERVDKGNRHLKETRRVDINQAINRHS